MDWILAQQVRRVSQKNKVENTRRAETVATAVAMLALSNIGWGHDRQATEARGEGENEEARRRQQQGGTIKTVPFLQQSSGDKKALKQLNNQPPKQRQWGRLVLGNGRGCFEADGRGLGMG
jgi:hypothetical protein